MPQQQGNPAQGCLGAIAGLFIIAFFMTIFGGDDNESIDATDPVWIEEQTRNIPSWEEEDIAADLEASAVAVNYGSLTERDKQIFWERMAAKHDVTVNQVKAAYNKHRR